MERTISTETLFKGRAVSLRVDTVEVSGGRRSTREIVEHGDCVAIIAVDEGGDVLLVRQFRHAAERALLEIPAGGIDSGEQPADCVRRELQEETGYFPGRVERLGGFYAAPGYCTEYLHLFLATDLKPSRLIAEDTDEIEVVRVSPEEAIRLIATGDICDAKSIAGLLTYYWKHVRPGQAREP
ncbi:MAG: NUDIX hydrolase [Dehalococcoidia bacterium]|nr:NUDIX hydrolase [Dehalococcoidia bacterium]